ncbi:MAG: nucleotidyltransferase family protein [Clostridia bacterium]
METITIPSPLPIVIGRDQLAAICRRYGVRELALFGSVLRNDFTADSDVDVLYELAPTSPVRSLFDLAALATDLEDLFGREVDLVNKHRIYPGLADTIGSTRQVVYVATD